MSLFIKGMNMPEVGSYKVIVFDDPVTKSRKLIINNSYKDDKGRIVGDYPMFDIQEIPTPHGDLIDRDKIPYCDYDIENNRTFVSMTAAEKEWIDEIPTILEAEE